LETLSGQAKEANRIILYATEEETLWERIATFFLGADAMPARYTRLIRMLHQAGYRGERAIGISWGLRIFLCLAFGFGGLVAAFLSKASPQDAVMLPVVGVARGYLLPYLTVY